jgi:glycosyltransferase involved in cell wall biosynthesis
MAHATKKQMRILLWSPGGAGEHYHGPGSFSYRLYSNLAPEAFAVTLAHGSVQQGRYERFGRQVLISALRGDAYSYWKFLRKGRRFVDRHIAEFDIFHGIAGFHSTMMPAYEASRRGIPTVVFLANHGVELADKSLVKRVLGLPRQRRRMAQSINAIVAMSTAIHRELLDYGVSEARITRIPMGTDTRKYRPAIDERERSDLRARYGLLDLPTLVFVGGVTRRKRPDLLIEALGNLRHMGMDIQLAVVGPEHDKDYCAVLRLRARELGVSQVVRWLGFSTEVHDLLRASNFFALPSECEGMPAALVEAMASGLPAIVTRISGSEDLVADGVNGRIVSTDGGEIAEALKQYLIDPTLAHQHGAAARSLVEKNFSLDSVADKYTKLFFALHNRQAPPQFHP